MCTFVCVVIDTLLDNQKTLVSNVDALMAGQLMMLLLLQLQVFWLLQFVAL